MGGVEEEEEDNNLISKKCDIINEEKGTHSEGNENSGQRRKVRKEKERRRM